MPREGKGNLLTPSEVLYRYPELVSYYQFSESDINKFAAHHILWGTWKSGKRLYLIDEDSVKHFIEYLNSCLERKQIKR